MKHQTLLPSEGNQKCYAKLLSGGSDNCDSQRARNSIKNCMIATGTGLVYQISGQWSIRAVASVDMVTAVKNRKFETCDDLVWFTDVTKYYDWIMEVIKNNK